MWSIRHVSECFGWTAHRGGPAHWRIETLVKAYGSPEVQRLLEQ
jgi:hypothetical protein